MHPSARQVGLDLGDFEACLNDGAVMNQVYVDAGMAVTLGVFTTPTFFIGIVEDGDRVRVKRRVNGVPGT